MDDNEVVIVNNDDNVNHGQNEAVVVAAEPRLLHDFQWYVETHGLRSEQDQPLSELNLREAKDRLNQEKKYQQVIHQRIFGEEQELEQERGDEQKRQALQRLMEDVIDVRSSATVYPNVPLYPLASSCGTVLALASSRHLYKEKERLELSLEQYSPDAVEAFVHIVLGQSQIHDVSPEFIVECCQIAHYVQCETVLNDIVEILVASVDTSNCMSLCQLADQLNLPILFERSLALMMQSVGEIENQEVWTDLSKELRERIVMIKEAIQSSIHSRGCRLYFSSLTEYLAIFAENVQYYKERLAEAKDRQREAARVNEPAWQDAQRKIEHQERRVRTLEAVMRQQKELFASRDETCRIYVARSDQQQRLHRRD